MNKVVLTGRITKDPEIKYTQNGLANIRFSLAVDRPGAKDANGNKMSDFISCVVFGASADFMGRYVKKGNMLVIEGRIQTGQYQNPQGQTVYTTDVFVDRVENLTPRETQSQAPAQQQCNTSASNAQVPPAQNIYVDDNDLPF